MHARHVGATLYVPEDGLSVVLLRIAWGAANDPGVFSLPPECIKVLYRLLRLARRWCGTARRLEDLRNASLIA